MITDPIADLLTRIRNGYMARLLTIKAPYSRFKEDILKILKKNKYIVSYEIENITDVKKEFIITLNNVRITKTIPTFKRISKPWQRIYFKAKDIKKSRNWLWIYILSTPKWIITWYEARSLNTGWELLCEIY